MNENSPVPIDISGKMLISTSVPFVDTSTGFTPSEEIHLTPSKRSVLAIKNAEKRRTIVQGLVDDCMAEQRYSHHPLAPVSTYLARRKIFRAANTVFSPEKSEKETAIIQGRSSEELLSWLSQVNQQISQDSLEEVQNLSDGDIKKLIKTTIGKIAMFRYTISQIQEIASSTDLSREERLNFVKTLAISVPSMLIINTLIGLLSEGTAAYIGLFASRNEFVQFMNSLDPAVRNIIAVALPTISYGSLMWVTKKKFDVSVDMHNAGLHLVPHPEIVAVKALSDKDNEESNFKKTIRDWFAHLSYPGTWADYKWFLMLFNGDFGLTFSLGNGIALVVGGLVVALGKTAIVAKKQYDEYLMNRRKNSTEGEKVSRKQRKKEEQISEFLDWLQGKSNEDLAQLASISDLRNNLNSQVEQGEIYSWSVNASD